MYIYRERERKLFTYRYVETETYIETYVYVCV